MSNLFKKITSATMALLIVLSIVSPVSGVMAAYTTLESANKLADLGVIVDNSANPANYRLGDSITRGEMAKVTMKLANEEVSDVCEGKFSDLKSADWACKYAEVGLANGYFAANATFRPMDVVTKIESLKMVMKARGIEKSSNTDWKAAYVEAAVEANIIDSAFTDYDTVAVRGWIFQTAANAVEGMEEDGEDDLLGDLLGDLGDEETTGGTGTGGTGTGENVVVKTGGDLEVTLSPETPAGANLPASAEGIAVASFDFTAGDADASISSMKLTRKGLGASDSVSNVALFVDGARSSKAKSFNSSDDTADVVLSPALVIKAGETITVVAKVNTTSTVGTFAIELTDVVSDGNVSGGKIVGNSFEVKSTLATTITLSNDGTVTAPKLGNLQAEVLKFKVKNNTSTSEDVTLSEITLKEDGNIDEDSELDNVALYYNGTKVADAISNGSKYFTFKLSTPVVIKDGKTEKFVVKADIIGGAANTIDFTLDNDLDVTASASKYGYVSVAGSVDTTALTVQAGEVTLATIDPTMTDVREDKDDIILGKIKVTPKGNELELSKVKFTVDSVAGNINNALENFELYDETNGVKYDLNAAVSGNDVVLTETDLAVTIKTDTTFVVRADTKASITSFDGYDFRLVLAVDSNNDSNIDANDVGFVLKETGDDELVTDITPSTLTWKTINGQESSAVVSTIVMSDSTSVIGSKGIEVAQFQVAADDSSALDLTEAKVHLAVATAADAKAKTQTITFANAGTDGDIVVIDGITYELDNNSSVVETATLKAVVIGANNAATASNLQAKISSTLATATLSTNIVIVTNNTKGDTPTAVADITKTDADNDYAIATTQASVGTKVTSSQVSAVYLYNGTTLLDQVSGSNLANGFATFDGFKETIAKNAKVTYTVKVDLVDDSVQATKRIAASIQSVDVEDEDSDDVVATGLPGYSARDLTISGVGTLVISVDNTDTETDKVKNVIANGTSPFVASFELTATNEAIKVKDLQVIATEITAADFVNSVSEVVLYKNDKTTEIDREPVTSTTVTFDNINYVVEEGNTNVYVKVVTRKIGKDSAGVQTADITLAVQATDVEGNSSGKAVTAGAGVISATSDSLAFAVVPVKVSAISFVSSYGGETVATNLTNGENTVGIIAVTTDSSTNTKSDGTSLKTELESMKFKVSTDTLEYDTNPEPGDVSALTVKKISGTVSATTVAQGNGTAMADGVILSTAGINIFRGVALGSDEELENGSTTYYVVKATLSGLSSANNKYFQLKLEDLDSGSNIEYSSNNSDDNETYDGTDNITSLRIGTTSVNGPSISSNY